MQENHAPDDNRRAEPRRLFNQQATIQVMESSDAEILGLTLETTIIDVSTHGLRMACDRFLHECSLAIWLDLADESGSLFLTTAVRWASWNEEDGFQIGLELIDNPLSELDKWVNLWARKLDLG